MPEQLPTTGQLENAQRIALVEARYSQDYSAPCVNLIEHFMLRPGEKSLVVPKVGRMTAADLVAGVDMVASEDIGMTTVELTAAEVGMKVILDDGLVLQANDDVIRMVGRQMGNGYGVKIDTDIIALFVALNGGTTLGADNINMTARNVGACISFAKSNRMPFPLFIVHHPNAVFALTNSLAPVGATGSVAIPQGPSADLLRNFWKVSLSSVPVYEDGNIAKIGSTDSGYGVIASKGAMAMLESQSWRVEPQRDASLRATELNGVGRYGVFEIDDTYGAPMRYEILDPSTSN